ncbi:hypothetical protein [Tautonia rosea]|uniref:hypothetical protein n=1 Tax=Tautonia rosea TaxID=2728037 RepID=UPI00147318CF|nr:hypothetical protein [Tautonia rosea]
MSEDELVIMVPIVAILMPLILVPTVIVLRQRARRREWEYRERMKAMEMGLPVPGSEVWASRVAIAIGAIMPAGVFGVAWLASLTTSVDEVWIAAAVVGIVGVIQGSRLANRTLSGTQRLEKEDQRSSNAQGQGKPQFDPDAYEAIVRHG